MLKKFTVLYCYWSKKVFDAKLVSLLKAQMRYIIVQ